MLILEEILKRFEVIEGFDLIEYNSLRDVSRKTEQIAINILAKVINKISENKNEKFYK